MSMHNVCLYLFHLWAGSSVVEVSVSVMCEYGCIWLLVIQFTSVYHVCKALLSKSLEKRYLLFIIIINV